MTPPHPNPTCPFCAIAAANPPSTSFLTSPTPSAPSFPQPSSTSPSSTPTSPSPSNPSPPKSKAHILLSTPHLLAFLDHAPISRGHVLLATRAHREKLGDVSVCEGGEVGRWLGVVSRAVMRGAGEGDGEGDKEVGRGGKGDRDGDGGNGDKEGEDGGKGDDVGDWNIVQNNGARAAQVVPHVHFHIIPRIGDVPEVKARSWTVFGKGQREDLDEEDAEILLGRMRVALGQEIERVRRREGDGALKGLIGERGGEGVKGGGSKL